MLAPSFRSKFVLSTLISATLLCLSFNTLAFNKDPDAGKAPWDQSRTVKCFNEWISVATYRLNTYNDGKRWNKDKPFYFNRYGVASNQTHYTGQEPADYKLYENRYHWMWDHYPYYKGKGWTDEDWNKAFVPPMKLYVGLCLQGKSTSSVIERIHRPYYPS